MMQTAAHCSRRDTLRAREEGVRVTATISKQQEQLLRTLADRHKVSVAWLIRHAIDRLLNEGDSVQLPLDLGDGQ
jgi:hypothetical protein